MKSLLPKYTRFGKKKCCLLDEERNELILPKSEQIPQDFFKKGENIRCIVRRVDIKNNSPVIIVSRTAPEFLAKLLEIEVPEIFDGLISIKKIVREPGERAKVAVESFDDRIDPVGACVGMKGSRIHGIVRELKNENIDVINFTSNVQLLIQSVAYTRENQLYESGYGNKTGRRISESRPGIACYWTTRCKYQTGAGIDWF